VKETQKRFHNLLESGRCWHNNTVKVHACRCEFRWKWWRLYKSLYGSALKIQNVQIDEKQMQHSCKFFINCRSVQYPDNDNHKRCIDLSFSVWYNY